MNLDQLGQTFEANKGPILAVAAAGVAGVALLRRRKAAAAPAAQPGQGVPTAPAVSAGGQTAGMNGAASYDSSASDVYGLVQPQLESLGNQLTSLQGKLGSVPVSAAPDPIASHLFGPTASKQFMLYNDGNVTQVQNDGSQLGLTWSEWEPLARAGASPVITNQDHPGGASYYTVTNLNKVPVPAAPTS